jgi:glycine cleavage system H lipoate-binding protein
MAIVFAVLTFAAFIALDYFVLSKRHAVQTSASVPNGAALPAAHQAVPEGVYLQPTFTWGRFGSIGEVYLGVHPMLLGLIGSPYQVELVKAGTRVAKGQPLARLVREGHALTVRSPITGSVEAVNRKALGDTQWRGVEGNDGAWIYRLQPDRVAEEVPRWFRGAQAAEWTKKQYQDLRSYLLDAVTAGHLGVVMADGGDLPVGILADMDQAVWAGLEDRFLTHAG